MGRINHILSRTKSKTAWPLKQDSGCSFCFNLASSFFDWTGTGHKKTKEKKPDPGILKGEEKSTEKTMLAKSNDATESIPYFF